MNRVKPADDARERSALPLRGRAHPWLGRALVFVTCVLVLNALFGERGLAESVRARREWRQASGALAQLRLQNAALREEARRLQKDPRTIEAVARRELGLIRRGEILVVVSDVRTTGR